MPRADFRCDVCEERWELPTSAKTCPDDDCPGLLHRIWDAAGSPRIGSATARQTFRLLDHGKHAQKPDVSHQFRRAMAEMAQQPAFVQQQMPQNDIAPHFTPLSRGMVSTLGAGVGRTISDTGGARGRAPSGEGPVEGPLAVAPRIRPAPQSLVDRNSEAMIPRIKGAK